MVSARVLNPVLSEFCKMSASPSVSRNLPYGRQLERIKRNLFGPTPSNLMENKSNPFNADLERHQELATQKWGFDFRADRPLNANGSFIWERVSSQESTFAPQMYTLTRAAHVRTDVSATSDMDMLLMERSDRENLGNSLIDSNSDSDEYDSQNESLPSTSVAAFSGASTSSSSTSCFPMQQRKRQLKITEFMKERKRLAQAPKKISPAKRMRTNSGSSSSSASIASTSASGSFGAHFGFRSRRN